MISYLVRIYLKAKVLDVEFLDQSASLVPVRTVKDMTMTCSADVVPHTLPAVVMSVPGPPEACH